MTERLTYEAAGQGEHAAPLQVDVIMVNSRGADNPWKQQALNSVRASDYPGIMCLVVDNNDHALTIGQAWNLALQTSVADLVLFLGDDDFLSPDLIGSLVAMYRAAVTTYGQQDVIMVTSPCTAVDEHGRVMAQLPIHHTGMYRRDWLLDHPFNERRQRYVDTEMHERITTLSNLRGTALSIAIGHQYGYMYRQHVGMVSGQKAAYQQQKAPKGMKAVR